MKTLLYARRMKIKKNPIFYRMQCFFSAN